MNIHVVNKFSNTAFQNNQTITSVDLHNIPFVDNDISLAFINCSNLTMVTNLNTNITSMGSTFEECTSLVNAPTIPNSVTDIGYIFCNCTNLVNVSAIPDSVITASGTFSGCANLVNAPTIPNSVTDITDMFFDCIKLTNVPEIPNSINSMGGTFSGCTNLITVPEIPNSVTDMASSFSGCTNLTGDINIYSNQITDADDCFINTTLDKNVYIPFTYENSINTRTYNAFINAGYSTTSRVHGVLLKDINTSEVTLTISPNPADATVVLTAEGYTQVGNSITVIPGTSVTYTVSKTGYFTDTDTITVSSTQTLPVVLSQATLTITPVPITATVTLQGSTQTVTGTGITSITTPVNEIVTYSVSAVDYETNTGYLISDEKDKQVPIILSDGSTVSLMVIPTPSDAIVTITHGTTVVSGAGTQILTDIPRDSTVTWDVFYQDESHHMSNDVYMSKSQTINIDVTIERFKVNVSATYSDKSDPFYGYCIVKTSEGTTLTGPAYFDNAHQTKVYVPEGDILYFGMFTEDFHYATGHKVTTRQSVGLAVYPMYTSSTYYLPGDSKVQVRESFFGLEIPAYETTTGTYSGNLCMLKKYYQPRWFSPQTANTNLVTTISREHFITNSESHLINWRQNNTVYLNLISDGDNWKGVTFNTTPADATVTMTSSTEMIDNEHTKLVKPGANISYTISATGYETTTGSDTISANKLINVELTPIS